MATHQDLLDAVAAIGARTGDPAAWMAGLSPEEIAVASNPAASPTALDGLLSRIRVLHPETYPPASNGPDSTDPSPGDSAGHAADAIRTAERALARQNSTAAQADLQVVTAVLSAHAAQSTGAAELDRLKREIEAAVTTRTDLDTPAGARAFQRYLIDKLREIRAVVESADLDSTSQAAVAAALSALYTSAAPQDIAAAPQAAAAPETPASTRPAPATPAPDPGPARAVSEPVDLGLTDLGLTDLPPDAPVSAAAPTPSAAAAPAGSAAPPVPAATPPAWGGFSSPGGSFGGAGMPSSPLSGSPLLPDPPRDRSALDDSASNARRDSAEPPGEPPSAVEPDPGDPSVVRLPGGETITAPSPQLAAVVAAAVGGTAISEAFSDQGIAIPAPGSPVIAPLDSSRLAAGDIGVFADRHALALGNGTALLDSRIQPIASVNGPGFIGWQHPPEPDSPAVPTPPVAAP